MDKKKFFLSLALSFFYLLLVTYEVSAKQGTIAVDNLNIRSGPGLDHNVIGQANQDTQVEILEESGEWTKIKTNQLEGWVASEYLHQSNGEINSTGFVSIDPGVSAISVRDQPTYSGNIIDQIKDGQTYPVLNQEKGWIQIELPSGQSGWVAKWLVKYNKASTDSDTITVLFDQTHFRSGPSVDHEIVGKSDSGKSYQVISKQGNWYEFQHENQSMYVAEWLVDATQQGNTYPNGLSVLKNKVIVIDAGHGGYDTGTIGVSGKYEKDLTERTGNLLAKKLAALGAKPLLTRSNDIYLPLNTRVAYSNANNADAFISIHYNSSMEFPEVHGIGSFYYDEQHLPLATEIQKELVQATGFRDRNVKFGNFLVIRENTQPSVLLELGFLSNNQEERTINTEHFQQQATNAIVRGLINHYQK